MTLDNIMIFFKKHFWIIIITLVFVIYAPVISAPLFWDDDDNIVNNSYVKNFDIAAIFSQNQIAGAGFSSNQYRPILSTSFAIEHALVGNSSFLYHLVNILIHLINGFLIYKLLNMFLKNKILPYILTAIFLIHPINTEAVSYIAGRTDLLGLLFLLLPLFIILKNKDTKNNLLLINIFFVLGILSKETDIIFSAILLFVYSLFRKSFFSKTSSLILRSFFTTIILAIFYMVLRLTIFNFQNTLNFYQTQNIFTESIAVRIYTFLSVIPSYVSLLFAPLTLYAERSSTIYTSLFQTLPAVGLLIIALFLAGFVIGIKKNKPLLCFGIAWFFITLFPVSNIFVPVNALITEHWLYIPFFGFLLIIGSLVDVQIKRINSGMIRVIGVVLIGLYLSFFTARTYARNLEWSDPIVFYEQTLKYSPSSIRVINNLAMLYANKNNFEKAKYYYEKAIALGDVYPQPHHNLGNMYATLGRYEKAEKEYLRAIEIDKTFSFSYNSLYNLYVFEKKTKEAEEIKKRFEELFISR